MNQNDSKICPYCSEEVKMQAIKCKHCKSSLDSISNISNEQDDKQNNNSPIVSHNTDSAVNSTSNESLSKKVVRNENKYENSSGAIIAIVLGSVGLLFSWVPILALFLCGIGLFLGIKHLKSNRRGLSIAATAICSVGLIINVVISSVLVVAFVTNIDTPGSQTTTVQSAQGSNYNSEMRGLLASVENNLLAVDFSSSSLSEKPVHIEHFAMIADLGEINNTIYSMDQIINDTTSALAKLRRINPPAEYESYHSYYLETTENYLTVLVNKRNFYDQNKYTASNIEVRIEKGDATAVFDMSKLIDENERQQSNLKLSLSTLKNATMEFNNLIR